MSGSCSSTNLEDGRILGPGLAVIVHAGRADIGVFEQFPDLGDVGAGLL
jgi:hypothetical protein